MRGGACAVLLLFLLVVGAKPLELNLGGLTAAQYKEFIAQLRRSLGRSDEIWTLPVLRSRACVPFPQRFVLVDITNVAGETVTLAVHVVDVYIVGYRMGNRSFFLSPDVNDDDTRDAIAHVFVGTERMTFNFTGGYPSLERYATVGDRSTVPLGTGALDTAVRTMNLYAERPTDFILHSVARGFIVCIQMISEAARFRHIEFRMRSMIERNVDSVPDPSIIELENSWGGLSEQIQRASSTDGVFHRSIQLQRSNYEYFYVSNVETILPYISLLKFDCQTPSSSSRQLHHLAAGAAATRTIISLGVTSGDPTCPAEGQSTCRILGPDGLCVDVKDGRYNNGNPVQLWPCSSNEEQVNQLWTFSSDGTLRSNGKCLASYGRASGDYIMIYDCKPGVDAFTWHSWPNGTISSPTGLVLSAHSSVSGTELAARNNLYATGQSWLPTNSTVSPVHQIAGLSGLYCLHADGGEGDDVVLRECANTSWWARYPDSSIRPNQARHLCLATPDFQAGQPLKLLLCHPNSSQQRWHLANDGTFINLSTGFVMDVSGPAVSGAHLTLEPWAGTDTQEWQPLL